MTLQPHQQRVVDERDELASKLIKLREFISGSQIYKDLPMDEQVRLKTQRFLMQEYWAVLRDRIENFS